MTTFFNALKLIGFLVVITVISVYTYYNYQIESPLNKDGADILFKVEKGDGVKKISAGLYDAKIIRSKFFFETYVWREGIQAKFQAGEYTLNPKLNIRAIARVFVKGDTLSKEKNIRIIEGWTTRDIGEYFEKENLARKEDLYQIVGYPVVGYAPVSSGARDFSDKYDFLKDKPKIAGLEGYMFPDTYRIYKDASAEDVIIKMLNNFSSKITEEMRDNIKKKGKTVYEVLTLASIIEKETGRNATSEEAKKNLAEERKIVAGIFSNRLKVGIALGSDATINYITGKGDPTPSLDDLKIDSPYNTYKYRGLPPGPISNPSLSSIVAAIYPADTSYMYFLHKQPSGEPVYSKTFEEHVKNKNKYLK